MEQTIMALVGQLGFPVFTAIYFMTRMETQMKETNKLLTILIERENRERVISNE